MTCNICKKPPAFRIRHCNKCENMLCGDGACQDAQDRLCRGQCVRLIGPSGEECLSCHSDVVCPGADALLYRVPVVVCCHCDRVADDCRCEVSG